MLTFLLLPFSEAMDSEKNESNLLDYMYTLCEKTSIDILDIYSIIYIESKWDPNAISNDGHDIGYMQIRITTARDYCPDITIEQLLKPKINIKIGILHYKYLLNYYNNDKIKAISAYNRGQRNVNMMKHVKLIKTKYYRSFINARKSA